MIKNLFHSFSESLCVTSVVFVCEQNGASEVEKTKVSKEAKTSKTKTAVDTQVLVCD